MLWLRKGFNFAGAWTAEPAAKGAVFAQNRQEPGEYRLRKQKSS
jgi:hypothetical protein